jgi:outer membrane immunogenic protein
MKKILLAGVAITALAVAAPANAADLRMPVKAAPIAAPAPYFSWTGCHVGAHVGWGWGRKDAHETRVSEAGSENAGQVDSTGTTAGRIDTSGAIFGGQVGCDIGLGQLVGPQWGSWVLGIEGSFAGTDINGFGGLVGSSTSSLARVKVDSLSSVTGRLGFSGWLPQTLLYVRGGWAWIHERWDLSFTFSNIPTASVTQDGWTIGAGIEWAFAPSWSAFVEWDHYDFGDKLITSSQRTRFSDTESFSVSKETFETVKIGVNYRFNIGALGLGKGVTARY